MAFASNTETVLFNFQGGAYGKYPVSFVRDASGNIYGTLNIGGSSTCNANCGVVYKLSPNANGQMTETIIHTFTNGDDGAQPTDVLMDANGNLFVAAYAGGIKGAGAIVELSPLAGGSWSTRVLYDFAGGIDGNNPRLTFIDAQGNLYGYFRSGQVFELSRSSYGKWVKKFLYLFDTSSGSFGLPWAIDASGNVYGIAIFGGNTNCSDGCGIVFELSPASGGWTETVLYNFAGTPDGSRPQKMIPDGKGNFFGITEQGGGGTNCTVGCGTLFELSPSSGGYTETVLHSFNEVLDGYSPQDLHFDSAGNLYVASLGGGVGGKGVVLEFTLGSDGIWEYTTLYSFAGANGGGLPYQIALDSSGDVYGIAGEGGTKSDGVLFELLP